MPLHAPPDYRCPFCAYVRGESDDYVGPEHVVERTAQTLTYVPPRWWPDNSGHLLVIPTAHFENLYEVPDHLGNALLRATRRAARALKLNYACAGTSTRQHNEPAGNQDVWHYHVHVFPRYEGDGLYGARGAWATKEDMAARATDLRAAFDQLDDEPTPPRVVCLCGSTRFREEFARAAEREARAGRIVVGPGVFSQADGSTLGPEEIQNLTRSHADKIRLADEVLVIDKDGYVGDATTSEVALAHALGKNVRYWSHESE